MALRNFSRTADYFERRAAKASAAKRRAHFESVAQLYRQKAENGIPPDGEADLISPPSRREQLAAMFRELGDPASIVRQRSGQGQMQD